MWWADALLIIIGGYSAYELITFARGRGRLKFIGLFIATCVFVFIELFALAGTFFDNSTFTAVSTFIIEWGHLICLAFILSALAIFIRESKPVFAQFPLVYSGLPLLIIISYFFVMNSLVLKEWLFFFYQGGTLLVALMMYSIYAYRLKKYLIILAGIILFLFCYILYWSIPALQSNVIWLTKLLLGSAILTTTLGYKYVHKY